MNTEITNLLTAIETLSETEILALITEKYPGKVVFSTSFGMEDQVITDFILKNSFDVKIFTLDTGRLFYETYTTWEQTNEYYHTKITPYYPEAQAIEEYVQNNGINAFYNSVALRQTCCHIRKVEPLRRALAGNKIWITGLRAEQSPHYYTGRPKRCYPSCVAMVSPITPCMTKDILVLAVLPALEPSGKEKTSEPAAGGGRTKPTKNVVCTYISRL